MYAANDGGVASDAPGGRRNKASEIRVSVERARKVLDAAEQWKKAGVPYRWGGQEEKGADCSGAVYAVYKNAGLSYPRVGSAQFPPAGGYFKKVDTPQAGDVACWPGHHMAIYAGKINGVPYIYTAHGTRDSVPPKKFDHLPATSWVKKHGQPNYYRYAK